MDIKSNSQNTQTDRYQNIDFMKGVNLKLSSDEFKKYIENRDILVEHLPGLIKILAQTYIERGHISFQKDNYIEKYEKIEQIINKQKSYRHFSLYRQD
ncbi:MAG: hypothetical protein MR902_00090 [Campylobacter sp.]|nr:hypothetical protein [Campylobacter sp.]